MAMRTIQFDQEEEEVLAALEEETCLPIPEVIKRAVRAFAESKPGKLGGTFGEFYAKQDLGPGGSDFVTPCE